VFCSPDAAGVILPNRPALAKSLAAVDAGQFDIPPGACDATPFHGDPENYRSSRAASPTELASPEEMSALHKRCYRARGIVTPSVYGTIIWATLFG